MSLNDIKKDFKQKTKVSGEQLRDSITRVLREYAEALVIAIFLALVLRGFVISAYKIPTSSMAPSLLPGDFIFSYKLPYGPHMRWFSSGEEANSVTPPERGDVVVFQCPKRPLVNCIKRVVGLPGDRIEIVKKRLVINERIADYDKGDQSVLGEIHGAGGGAISGPYAVVRESILGDSRQILVTGEAGRENFGPVVVPPGHMFVLADHRDFGDDSRSWGTIPLRKLRGKAMFVWLSLDWRPDEGASRAKVRWSRILESVN